MNKQTNKVFVNPNIERLKAIENTRNVVLKLFFQRLGGRVFHADFVKASGEVRTMGCRLQTNIGIKGTGTRKQKENILNVYEMSIQDYRSINLNNLRKVKCGKIELEIK